MIRHWVELLSNPFFISLGLLFLCLCCWHSRFYSFIQPVLWLVLIGLLLLSTGWLPRYLTHQLEFRYPVVQQADPQIKWVVVFSGGQSQIQGLPVNDIISSASIKRLVEGIRLLRALPEAQLILSGGGLTGELPEALNLAKLTEWFSIPKQKVLLETKSLNTAEQARYLVAMLDKQPFYLVTSAIHMPRAMALCQNVGLNPIAAPTDFTFFWEMDNQAKIVVPNVYNLYYFSIAFHELLGRAWAALPFS